jgi:hypothetical protein
MMVNIWFMIFMHKLQGMSYTFSFLQACSDL